MSISSNLSDAVERMLASADLSARVESVYHYVYEQDLSDEEKAYVLDRLMPQKDKCATRNADLVTDSFIEDYFAYRSMGMSIKDTAALLSVTTKRLQSILAGSGLDASVHKRLLERELKADAMCKFVHLDVVTQAAKAGSLKAAMFFLERRYPDEFGQRQRVTNDISASVTLGTSECEERALEARKRLSEIRDARKEAAHAES